MTEHNRITRFVIALVLCLATLVTLTTTASATESKAKLHAQLLDTKVKVDKDARIKGALEVDSRSGDGRSLEPIVVQRLVAGAWVDVYTTDCRPNYTFRLNVSFSVAAEYQLRVYNPTMGVFSGTLLLRVVL